MFRAIWTPGYSYLFLGGLGGDANAQVDKFLFPPRLELSVGRVGYQRHEEQAHSGGFYFEIGPA